jgi:hypothetical protein
VPLTYLDRGQSRSGTQFSVLAGMVYIGSINKTMHSTMAKDHERWDWLLVSHYGPPGYCSRGQDNSLPEAKTQLEAQWSAWLDAADLTEK